MENNTENTYALLQETFRTLEALMPQKTAEAREKSRKIINLLENRFSEEHCLKALNIVSATYKIIPERSRALLESRILMHFDDKISRDEASKVLNIIVFNTEVIADESDILSGMIQANSGLGVNTASGDEVNQAEGQFGYDLTNPIPVNGIDRIDDYFRKLKLITGENITYSRKGSVYAGNLPAPVDVYIICNAEGESLATLYVYAYHGQMTKKAPDGFMLIS